MGYPLQKLTRKNQHNFFGVKVKHGELFNYSQAFLFKDIQVLAKKHGFWVDYCKPETDEYMKHGTFTVWAYEISEPLLPQWESFKDKIGDLLLQFEAKKNEAAKVRDDLREIAGEIQDIVESFYDGVDGMEEALETFRHALDDMSRYV